VSDAEALDWLDRLLTEEEECRAATLRQLAARNPALHARLQRLLASALSPDHSQDLAAPVLDGVARVAEATRVLAPGDLLAGYRLLRELGRGGMSVVWLAERADGVVKRQVALKMPMFMLQGAADVERFARERDALAALSHPHVARLYDAGVMESGQPYIVLEHVDGEPLTVFCDARRLDVRARVRLYLQVLSAVEHAHKHLVVHRDLKPSNILVDAEGHVRLLDFGIAKLLGDEPAGLTLHGAMTPLYAAPEQIHGEAISTLADVYSLGVLLHELLTGVLPYKLVRSRATAVDIHQALTRGELPRASEAALDEGAALSRGLQTSARLRGELGGDLDTIVSKALRIQPEDRYPSAAHLADDLRRWLDHQPIAARRPSFWYGARLALRRHRLAASVAATGLLLVMGASALAWMQHLESRAHEQRTAAVRDFMFDLVSDAEAKEGQEGEVTGRQMLDDAVLRARRDFGGEPQLQGELLSELGRMYTRLAAPESAIEVLEESIRILEPRVPSDDPALNKSRVFLAGALMQTSDDAPRIEALARAARDGCASEHVDCRKARGYAGNILSQLASFAGDDSRALEEMRRSAADVAAGFGEHHEETALAIMSLAITARNAGGLTEAGVAMGRAVELARGLKMRAADRVLMERTMAIIDHDLGRFEAARDRLLPLVQQTSEPTERARQLRILANVYAELGDGPAALRSAEKAVETLPGDDISDERAYIRQARARAWALIGEHDRALAEIDTVIAEFIGAGLAPTAFKLLRAQRYRAEFLLLAGRNAEALQSLRQLRDRHGTARVSPVEVGLMLDSLGEAERRAGDPVAARGVHEEARHALAGQLSEGHPYLVRNAVLRSGAKIIRE
jgi:tetratricopeptide (TPR) repeat protein/tRNA A-37 threonylcarbamoyl transferase component Bud32